MAAALPSGRTSATTRSMPAVARDCLGGPSVVAGEHGDRDPEPSQLGDGLGRSCLERVCDRDDGGRPAVDRREDRGLAVGRQGVGRCHERRRVDSLRLEEAGATDEDPVGTDGRRHPAAGDAQEIGRVREDELAGLGRFAHDRVAERVLRAALRRRDKAEDRVFVERAVGADDVGDPRPALGEGAGLVEDDGLDRAEPFEGLGVAEQDAVLGSLARPDHDRGRRREAERTRARDDEDRHGIQQGEVERRLRAEGKPDDEGERGESEDDGHEVARHDVGEALDRGSRALGLGHEPHDPREDRVGADAGRSERQGARRVERATGDQVVGALGDGQALPRDHALVDARCAVGDDAVDGDRLAGSDAHQVTDPDLRDRDIDLRSVAEDPRRPRGEVDQAPDGVRRVAPGAGLEEPSHQDERDDRRRRVEVHGQRLAVHAQSGGDEERREQDRRDTVAIGRGRADRDERVHVGGPVAERLDGTDVEDRPGPELHGRRESQLEPGVHEERRQPWGDGHPGEPEDQRERQDGRDRQPSAQVGRVSGRRLVALRLRGRCLRHISLVIGARGLLDAGDVARGIDRTHQVGDGDQGRVVADGRGFRGEVDVGRLHALDPGQEPRDPVDAGRAGHSFHREGHDLDVGEGGGGHARLR